MKSISFDRKMRYVAMAMAVAAGIGSVAVPVYAAPAENTVATDNTNKKEAGTLFYKHGGAYLHRR